MLGFNDTSTLVGNFVLPPTPLPLTPEKGRKEKEERVEEMKERDREERGTVMKEIP